MAPPPRTLPVREGYDRWAEVYDVDGNPLVGLEELWFDAVLGPVAGLDVLDLGCGTGRHAIRLARQGARVVALDVSPGMLARAREGAAGLGIDFRLHDLHAPLPLPPGTFARVVSGLVLEHLRDLAAFFREVARVLAPGGIAVVSTIHPAMRLRGTRARFTDPASGEVIHVEGEPQTFAAIMLAALGAGLLLDDLQEHAPDAAFAARLPRAQKYVGWPLLLLLRLARPAARSG
jgi:malonyl-CoA O-methyltransferase